MSVAVQNGKNNNKNKIVNLLDEPRIMRFNQSANPVERNMKQQNPVLNPKLQGVLSCLDVQLEAELMRYRRQKAKARSQPGKANPLAALDLKSFNTHTHPLREPVSAGFSLGQAVPVLHPERDPSLLSVPLSIPEPPPPLTPSVHYPPQRPPLTSDLPTDSEDLPTALEDFRIGGDLAEFDRFSRLEPFDSGTDRDLYGETGVSSLKHWDGENPSDPVSDLYVDPYVIVTESYNPEPVNWSAIVPGDEGNPLERSEETALEIPLEIPLETKTPFLESATVETLEAETEWVESLVLPAELSEAELSTLGGLPLAIVPARDWADEEIADDEISDYEIRYEISDEDNPWPDELDEEPYALDLSFANGMDETPSLATNSDMPFGEDSDAAELGMAEEIEQEMSAQHISPQNLSVQNLSAPGASPHQPLPQRSGKDTPDPLMLPAAEHRQPTPHILPAGQYAPHHLKPLARSLHIPPEVYLASSEALLDNLEEEEGRQNWPQRLSNLFTPQGIGSALLLIFSALAVSMVLLNPELVSHWKLGRFAGSAPEPATNPSSEAIVPENPQNLPIQGSNPYSLSSQEFLNLDLGNLSKVKPQNSTLTPGGSAPSTLNPAGLNSTALNSTMLNSANVESANASTAPPGSSETDSSEMFSDLRDSLTDSNSYPSSPTEEETAVEPPPPRSAPVAARAPVSAPVSPPVMAEPEAPNPGGASNSGNTSSGNAGNTYVVVTPYTSDQLLDQSQTIVPDAYLKNTDEGANIQFGVFSDPDAAAAMAEQLQEQGIAVEVRPAEP